MLDENAKAVQEVAKATSKALETSEKLGAFFSKVMGGLVDDAVGIAHDRIKFLRWERALRLQEKADEILLERGVNNETALVPPKLAIPLLEAATLEENDDLHDMWCRLLANAMDPKSELEITRSMIGVLNEFEPRDAQLLGYMHSAALKSKPGIFGRQFTYHHLTKNLDWHDRDIERSLRNLSRLGCIRSEFEADDILLDEDDDWISADLYEVFILAPMGVNLVNACLQAEA